ncbi:MAG TPA: glycosyltransferase [Flavipsychrobacter sp.]|nr:glycosyltransferase [Flavipsychrobacter sp.]
MAVYNGEAFLIQQINSILLQLGTCDELIISDDGSTDGTLAIINSLDDPRITLLSNGGGQSATSNFDNALKYARNDIIFLSDQDDIWLAGKVEKCCSLMKQFDVVVTNAIIVDQELVVVHPSYFEQQQSGPGLIKNLLSNKYLGCCIAFRRTCMPYFHPFPSAIPMHDIWIGFVAEVLRLKIHFETQPFLLYRRHSKNASTASGPSINPINKKLNYRFNLVKYFPLIALRFFRERLRKLV